MTINKPMIPATYMVLIREKADEVRNSLEKFSMDLSMDLVNDNYPDIMDWDEEDWPEELFETQERLMGFIADAILQDIRREF